MGHSRSHYAQVLCIKENITLAVIFTKIYVIKTIITLMYIKIIILPFAQKFNEKL